MRSHSLLLDDRRIAAALALLAALPVLLVPVTGMVDLPNHIARFRVFEAIGTGSPLDRLFVAQWRWIGNLGVDLPVRLLSPLLGLEGAARLVVAAIAPLTLLGALALSRAAHGRITGSAAVALALTFSHAWYYGFVNYCLATALALLAGAAWIARPPARLLPALGFGVAALAIWTAHLGGWAILLMIVAGVELASLRSWRALPRRIAAALPLLLPLVPLVAWRSAGGGQLFNYGGVPVMQKIMAFVTMLNGVDKLFDLASLLALAMLAGLALLWAGGRRIEPRLACAAVVVTFATLAVPSNVMESWGADMRMAPVAAMLAILAIGPAADARRERVLVAAGLALFIVRDVGTLTIWESRSRPLEARLALLDAVPAGARLGFVSAESACRTPWPIRPDHALAAYAVTRRGAFTNTMFHNKGTDIMTPRRAIDAERWTAASQDIKAICPAARIDRTAVSAKLAALAADGFDLIWMTGVPAGSVALPPGFAPIRAAAGDTLYGRVK